MPLTEVYTAPLMGAPKPVDLVKGNIGLLYLTRAGWEAKSSDGFALFDKGNVPFKIPNCAAALTRLLTPLSVVPTSILIRGHLEGDVEFFDLEMLGPDAAESQALHWSGANYLDVRLSSPGARRLRLKSRSTIAKIWPISIKIKGRPAIDLAVSGEVDLLGSDMADGEQNLIYAKSGAPIKLVLTQVGVAAFHLTPQAVAEITKPCHGCVERGGKRASAATRRRTCGSEAPRSMAWDAPVRGQARRG